MNRKSIFNTPKNHIEILNIINNMENKNGGIDCINTKTLKTLSVHIVDELVHICNLCIDKTTWPDALKIFKNEKHHYQLQTYFANIKLCKKYKFFTRCYKEINYYATIIYDFVE